LYTEPAELVAELGAELVDEAEELVDEALVEDAAAEEDEEAAEAGRAETSWACWTPDELLIVPTVLFM
jgi:hypothetical protein